MLAELTIVRLLLLGVGKRGSGFFEQIEQLCPASCLTTRSMRTNLGLGLIGRADDLRLIALEISEAQQLVVVGRTLGRGGYLRVKLEPLAIGIEWIGHGLIGPVCSRVRWQLA
jgi:hypothetical protein